MRRFLQLTRWLLLLGVALSGGAGCERAPEPPLRIGTLVWPGYEPLFLARSLGYYDDRRVKLVEFSSPAEMLLAFENHAIEGVTSTLDDVLRLAHAGQEPRIVLMLDYSHGADVIMARPEVADLAALKGRKVGVETNTLGAFVLTRALETVGLASEDVQPVTARIVELERGFGQGEFDAVVTYEPYRTRLLAGGARQIFDSSSIPGEIADVLIVRRDLAEHPTAALRQLGDGWFRALDYLAQHPEDAARRVAPREGVTPAEFLASLELLALIGRTENQWLLGAADSPLPQVLQRLADFMRKKELIVNRVDVQPLRSASVVGPLP